MDAQCPYIPSLLHSCQLFFILAFSLNNVFKRSVQSVKMYRILFSYFQLDGFVQTSTTELLLSSLHFLLLYKIKYLQPVYFLSPFSNSTTPINYFSFTQNLSSVTMHNTSILEFDAV
jgi:hypothetical protein